MIIGTTPTFTLKLRKSTNINFHEVNNIYITLKQGTNILTKNSSDIQIVDNTTLRFSISQAESLNFAIDKVIYLQVNWTYIEGLITRRAATKVVEINLERQLLREVLN